MSKRLQVVLKDEEFAALRKAAAREGTTVSAWVRRTLWEAQQQFTDGDAEQRLAVVRSAARHAFPTADVDQMLGEIEAGYQPS